MERRRERGGGTPNAAGEGYPAKPADNRHMGDHLCGLDGPIIFGVDTNSRFGPPTQAHRSDTTICAGPTGPAV